MYEQVPDNVIINAKNPSNSNNAEPAFACGFGG